jgi:probable F420-dependent oxidoreductase
MRSIEPGQRWIGTQLPIQAQSSRFAAPWERTAGPAELARIAKACDAAGFDYLAVCDHIAIPEAAAEAMGTHWADPIATLSWLAGQTSSIGLLTHVYVLPFRSAAIAAKQLATLDHLSGGRLIAGIGAGHVEAEFELLGVPFAERGRLMDERLPQLAQLLEHEFVDGFGAAPRPAQSPRPPMWIAGSSAPARRRAASIGDGWLPQGPATDEMIDDLFARLDAHGRAVEAFAVGHITAPVHLGATRDELGPYTIAGSAEEVAERLLAHTPVRANQLQIRMAASSAEECADQYAQAGEELLPLLRSGIQ